ncbi:MAG: DUF3465 domain-containing protein [Oscillospiraceae bacterium]|jgi:hypothetical protein|nr:DUF3465 domain-containing protein [Oscillospiraceae bacterium]
MYKKIISLILALSILSVGCSKDENTSKESDVTVVTTISETVESTAETTEKTTVLEETETETEVETELPEETETALPEETDLPVETVLETVAETTTVKVTETAPPATETEKVTTITSTTVIQTTIVIKTTVATVTNPPQPSSDDIIKSLFDSKQTDVQIQGKGVVTKVLADDNDGSRHQRFILKLNSGQTLLVAHNIDLAPRIEGIAAGDTVEFYGEYYYNDQGGGVHWTHKDPDGSHVAGYLKWNGKTYQ